MNLLRRPFLRLFLVLVQFLVLVTFPFYLNQIFTKFRLRTNSGFSPFDYTNGYLLEINMNIKMEIEMTNLKFVILIESVYQSSFSTHRVIN